MGDFVGLGLDDENMLSCPDSGAFEMFQKIILMETVNMLFFNLIRFMTSTVQMRALIKSEFKHLTAENLISLQ